MSSRIIVHNHFPHRSARDVKRPHLTVPSGPTGVLPKHPTNIEPPEMVSGNAATSLPSDDVANKDRSKDNKFRLPDKVTTQEIRDGSFRYGGGRSAGNRSLADNMLKKVIEP